MYPSCCVISLKRIESTCCHTQYINFVFFFLISILKFTCQHFSYLPFAQNVYYGSCANLCQIVISFLLVTISVMAATMLWQISSVPLHCICEVVILRVYCCRLGLRCVELFETWHVSCRCPQALSHLQLQTA